MSDIADKIKALKEKYPQVGKSIRKKFPKPKTEAQVFEDKLVKIKLKYNMVLFSEISRVSMYFNSESWHMNDKRLLLYGNLDNKMFVLEVTGYNKQVKADTKMMVTKSDTKFSTEVTHINKSGIKLTRLHDCKFDFYKSSTMMEVEGEIYATENPLVFIVMGDIMIKKLQSESVDYAEVLERLKAGKLKTDTGEEIKEDIPKDVNMDKLIDEDIEQILSLKNLSGMNKKQIDEMITQLSQNKLLDN